MTRKKLKMIKIDLNKINDRNDQPTDHKTERVGHGTACMRLKKKRLNPIRIEQSLICHILYLDDLHLLKCDRILLLNVPFYDHKALKLH